MEIRDDLTKKPFLEETLLQKSVEERLINKREKKSIFLKKNPRVEYLDKIQLGDSADRSWGHYKAWKKVLRDAAQTSQLSQEVLIELEKKENDVKKGMPFSLLLLLFFFQLSKTSG